MIKLLHNTQVTVKVYEPLVFTKEWSVWMFILSLITTEYIEWMYFANEHHALVKKKLSVHTNHKYSDIKDVLLLLFFFG